MLRIDIYFGQAKLPIKIKIYWESISNRIQLNGGAMKGFIIKGVIKEDNYIGNSYDNTVYLNKETAERNIDIYMKDEMTDGNYNYMIIDEIDINEN